MDRLHNYLAIHNHDRHHRDDHHHDFIHYRSASVPVTYENISAFISK